MSSVVTRTRRFSLRSVTHKYKYARAFTFLFLVMKRNAETSIPRRSAKAPTGASSRAPPPSAERDARAVARRSPPDSTRRGARVVRARVPRRSRRYPRCLDASQPERLGDQGERLLERRTTRARFKKNAASLLPDPAAAEPRRRRAPRREAATRASVSACGARSGAKARSVPPGFRGSATRTPASARRTRRPREFRGPFPGDARPTLGARCAPGEPARTSKRDVTVVGVFLPASSPRLRSPVTYRIGQLSRAAYDPGAHGPRPPRSGTRRLAPRRRGALLAVRPRLARLQGGRAARAVRILPGAPPPPPRRAPRLTQACARGGRRAALAASATDAANDGGGGAGPSRRRRGEAREWTPPTGGVGGSSAAAASADPRARAR